MLTRAEIMVSFGMAFDKNAYQKAWRVTHRSQVNACKMKSYFKNRESILAKQRAYVAKNREKIVGYKKAWRVKNLDMIKLKSQQYFVENRDKILAQNRAYYADNRDRVKIVAKAYRDRPENKEKQKIRHRRRHLIRKYRLSLERFNEIFAAQGRKCLICETDEFGRHGPVIDHCHNEGQVRGILCQQCNALIGMARNSPRIMTNALRYLSKELIFNSD